MSQENRLLPIFVKLDEVETLLVGGGKVGGEKLTALLKNDSEARVTLVSPSIRRETLALCQGKPNVRIKQRRVLERDVAKARLVVAATNDKTVNQQLRSWCHKTNVLLNVADKPSLCDFYLGSTVKKGNLKVGISTNGKSPTFAKRLREVLESELPEEIGDLLEKIEFLPKQTDR